LQNAASIVALMLMSEVLSPTLSKMQKCPLPERARAECTKDPRVAPESSSRGFANSEAVPSRSFGLAAEREKTEQFDPEVNHMRADGGRICRVRFC
jgi:hypothetical protein